MTYWVVESTDGSSYACSDDQLGGIGTGVVLWFRSSSPILVPFGGLARIERRRLEL